MLVVDDDSDSRELLVRALEAEGYTASGAENGSEAIHRLETGLDPDLILTDLVMPVMSGWDFCDALKNAPAWRSIPVVALCGMAAEQRGKLRVDDAFEKPIDISLLLRRIAELCGL